MKFQSKYIRPTSIKFEASSACQLRCPSCPTTTKAIHPTIGTGFLKIKDFARLLYKNPYIEKIELSNYGEIFLNPEILEIIKYAYKKGVKLSANNGVNLNKANDEILEGLVKYDFATLRCSLDGASNETYSKYRIKGNFDQVIENIKKINSYKDYYHSKYPILIWQFVVFGHNEHEILVAKEMAKELNMTFALKISWDESFSPIKDHSLVRKYKGFTSREEYNEKFDKAYLSKICHEMWKQPQINWDGKILGCSRNFWGEYDGNAFRDGFINSINNDKIMYAREMLKGNKEAKKDIPCTTCDIYLDMKSKSRYIDVNSFYHENLVSSVFYCLMGYFKRQLRRLYRILKNHKT